MRFLTLEIDGFGRLAERTFAFSPGLNVVFGENEAGKSTLAQAIVATLYGLARKEERDRWRPWSAPAYATRLRYVLSDGTEYEVQRDFERDPRRARVYDRNGNDRAGELAVGKAIVPGAHHLSIPLEVFVNGAFVRQQAVEIDAEAAPTIGQSLAHALDGGPRDDAALGAIKRLDEALRKYVGTERATKHTPLRSLREAAAKAGAEAEATRAALAELDTLRARLERELQTRDALARALAEHARRGRALRIASLRKRLADLRTVRDDVAALQAKRADYDDVAAFPSERVAELEAAYAAWQEQDARARAAEEEARAGQPGSDEAMEHAQLAPSGTLEPARVAAVVRAAAEAERTREQAATAAAQAAAAQRAAPEADSGLRTAAIASALFAGGALAFAVARWWIATALVAACAVVACAWAVRGVRARRASRVAVGGLQRDADAAAQGQRAAGAALADLLHALGVPNASELERRRARYDALDERMRRGAALRARADALQAAAAASGATFATLADRLVPPNADPAARLAAARRCEARARERAGIEASLSMHDLRRRDLLGTEDEFALERELRELAAAGEEEGTFPEGLSLRAWDAQRSELEQQGRQAERVAAATAAELRTREDAIPDIAALDDVASALGADIARLEAFERAATLARDLLEERAAEVHQTFARRLETYAGEALGPLTAARYDELRIDPATFAIRVRAPETGAFVGLRSLSAGTREQVSLVVRFAIARMLSEGLERPPLLLDDPFAYWDTPRLERCFPVLEAGAAELQTIVFTSSPELAEAAARRGAARIDLMEHGISV